VTPGDLCNFVVARQYSIVKELDDFAAISTRRVWYDTLRRLLMSVLKSLDAWWAWIDSNYRPRPYQGRALAT
jgi:hypothetical protein